MKIWRGFSVYLQQDLDDTVVSSIKRFAAAGFKGVFTSLNLPEDDSQVLLSRLRELIKVCQAANLSLTTDVSIMALKRLKLTDLHQLAALGVDQLRIDNGFKMSEIAALSQDLNLALNASTISPEDCKQLRQKQANFKHLEAWHNYYPRQNTGLGREWFSKRNLWLVNQGFQVMAFVPGDAQLRGPVFATLPTLEQDRFKHPLAAMLQMANFGSSKNYLGDPGLKALTLQQFTAYFNKETLLLPAQINAGAPDYLLEKVFHQRSDVARDVIRLEEGRALTKVKILPQNQSSRPRGTITLDNCEAKRYQGELEITLTDLAFDKTVNVIGQVLADDQELLDFCPANQKIKIHKVN